MSALFSKISASEYFNKMESASLKDLMDILSNRSINVKDADSVATTSKDPVNSGSILNSSKQIENQINPPQSVELKDTSLIINALKKLLDFSPSISTNIEATDLMMSLNNISHELENQHLATTFYKGDFFNVLRNILKFHSGNDQIKNAVVEVLRSFASQYSKNYSNDKIIDLMSQLSKLLIQMNDQDACAKIRQLTHLLSKNEASDVQEEFLPFIKSILLKYSDEPKVQNFIKEIVQTFDKLLHKTSSIQNSMNDLINLLENPEEVIESFKNLGHNVNLQNTNGKGEQLTVLEKILTIVEKNLDSTSPNDTTKIASEQILKSMLSGQNLKTPMLHFVIPVQYEGTQALGELWIEPEGNSGDGNEQKKGSLRILIAMDVKEIGRFEADLLLNENNLNIKLLCPIGMLDIFNNFQDFISQTIQNSGFIAERVEVLELKHPRTLSQAFDKPFERRSGINVRA